MPTLSDEQKKFISAKYLDEKKQGKEIINLFNDEYGFMPSASTINKYLNYNEIIEEAKVVKPKKEEEKAEDIELSTKDTRKLKGVIDFSTGDISDEDFSMICKAIGKNQRSTFDLLQKSIERGYKKINLETGEVSK